MKRLRAGVLSLNCSKEMISADNLNEFESGFSLVQIRMQPTDTLSADI